jgi:hypothetical protein
MPHQEKHPAEDGVKVRVSRLDARGLEVVGLRIGDRVALEGEQKPSEIKVSKLERNGETFAIGHGPHDTREDEADPAIAIKTAEDAGYQVIGGRTANQSILRCWEKRAPNLRSFTSSSTEVFGRLNLFPRTITNGNPKWSRRAPRKAHLMNAETDRRA